MEKLKTVVLNSTDKRAKELAQQLGLICVEQVPADCEFILEYINDQLSLRLNKKTAPGPLAVDFLSPQLTYRRQKSSGRSQILARAIGIKGNEPLDVLDATAGLGIDSFAIACLGAQVTGLEKSAIVYALLQDGESRASRSQELSSWIPQRLHFIQAEARDYLTKINDSQKPDVIYLDPMFPHQEKSALSSKEMQILQALLGASAEVDVELVELALQVARKRVVVKRPLRSQPLAPGCRHSLEGKSMRYDIYLVQ